MANSLNMDLTDKVVILRQVFFAKPLINTDHPFKVSGGFGAMASTNGRMLAGTFISDGEDTAVSGYDVERLATDEEIARFTTRDLHPGLEVPDGLEVKIERPEK